jgi:hypothetical protein
VSHDADRPRSGLTRSTGRRSLDLLGIHGLLAFLAGVAVVAVVGIVIDPLGFPSRADAVRSGNRGFEEAYAERQPKGFDEGFEAGYTGGFALGVLGEDSGTYRDAFEEGYRRGWDESISAADQAARAVPLPADATEFRILSRMPDGASAVERLASDPDS